MAADKKGFKSLAVGPEGSGKSAAQWFLARNEPHLIALEIQGDPMFKDVDAYVKSAREFMVAIRAYHKAKKAGKKYRITWSVARSDDYMWALGFVILRMREAGGGALFIDESETFVPCRKGIPEDSPLFELGKHSRHMKIRTYMTAHKPTELHNKFRSNLTQSLYFYSEDGLTIEHIAREKRLHHKRDDIDNLLLSLGNYEYLLSERGKPLKKMPKLKI